MCDSITLEELRGQIRGFEEELTWANGCWSMFQRLFMSDPADVDRMNASARHFFMVLDNLLMHEIIASLCRITDTPSMGKHANLTFERLVQAYKGQAMTDNEDEQRSFERELDEALLATRSHMSALREMRNARLSHLDQGKALDRTQWAIPLPDIAAVLETLNTYATKMRLPLFGKVEQKYMDPMCRDAATEILHLLRGKRGAAQPPQEESPPES